MQYFGQKFGKLVEELSHLPGIGSKSAQRLAFHIISMPREQSKRIADAILDASVHVQYCQKCYTFSDESLCPICKSDRRDTSTIMVVEEPKDMAAYEKTKQYQGLYHVLHGTINPMAGITPEQIKIKELIIRLGNEDIKEIILATNSTAQGEMTAVYISKLVKQLGVKSTRIANGVPVGGDLEYVDEVTLLRALEGRTNL